MDFPAYKNLVASLKIGKRLPDAIYLHQFALNEIDTTLASLTIKISDAVKIDLDAWNIVKFYTRDFKVAFLNYPDFFDYAYPSLTRSYTVDLAKLSVRQANYATSDNPPILHRKETFLPPGHEACEVFATYTAQGEALGLYENTRSIGFKKNWERLIASKGYYLDPNGSLLPLVEKPVVPVNEGNVNIERHKTAIDRSHLSSPMKVLARHGYLSGDYSLLDYGCGKGDDVRELEAHGIDVSSWDPNHNPEGELIESDIVNLGFVLNVIEDREERDDTLKRAWEYANKLLVVSVMIAGDSVISQFKPYKDGVLTSRNTFQRYYSQGEFRYYLESVLQEEVIAVGQGIFVIFKDKIEEQTFLVERQHIKRNWQQKTQREIKARENNLTKDIIDRHIDLFTDFWETSLELGRIPANSEFEFSDQIRRIAGSHNKAHQALVKQFGESLFKEAHTKRKEDLIVYFALGLFEKRKPQTQIPEGLKRDIKAFFESYNDALEQARSALFAVGNPEVIREACYKAYDQLQCGEMNEGHSYTFHKDYLGDIPPELRIYVGCATQLYGDLEEIQLIKAHMLSGKVSLMGYKNWESETPMLVERIKIKLREQDVDFFDYVGEYQPEPLNNKIIFLEKSNIIDSNSKFV
ncbi:DNA phosphorothioation-associated putative methyltransferase [Aestuariirhabdus litorea]|uniref:DNA phosphorothioation-associated putative methyltransferase n=1 Tax=Aestuariirhabdus litorea TaxID=2528527 RepID=A0A3P3VPM6_9GAMM|nr:DNA phosphorothioation-associated putative methyltransferase [Aestuariirhabdus litorea]RRJ84384.1 DNA phosphorothioation-associated putative methyltransferase [Aestuariirhabdus litorea]RWW97608.1 DNA phosphorothioation-associated putative methyltransferase [Endozoicomonadaceae bacterium GTF-13]